MGANFVDDFFLKQHEQSDLNFRGTENRAAELRLEKTFCEIFLSFGVTFSAIVHFIGERFLGNGEKRFSENF